jgi:hypothetical protein
MPRRREITADASLEQAKKTSPTFKKLLQESHHGHGSSVRKDHYKGHHIVIRTKYDIEIDGKPFHGDLDVSNAGTVHYHGIPNVSSNSAVELMRAVIDSFPDDFGGEHEEETPHHGHASSPSRATGGGGARKQPFEGRTKAARKTTGKEKSHARSRKRSH